MRLASMRNCTYTRPHSVTLDFVRELTPSLSSSHRNYCRMTGYVDQGMILSSLTVASLEDMGYNVDYSQAEPFDFAGDCCSGARRGRRGRRLRGLSERRLSPENKETATEYGQMVLKKFNCQKATEFEQSEKLLLLDTVKVYVLQDGHVIDVEVTLDEYEASP